MQENTTETKPGEHWHSLWPKYFNNLDSLNSHPHHLDKYLGWLSLQLFWIYLVTFHPSLLFEITSLIILPYQFVIPCLATVHTMQMSHCQQAVYELIDYLKSLRIWHKKTENILKQAHSCSKGWYSLLGLNTGTGTVVDFGTPHTHTAVSRVCMSLL